jgi:threonine dehydratase
VLTREDVVRARAAIGDRLAPTPTLYSRALRAHLKCELFQRTGSFKPRGALNKLSSLTAEERRRGVITISAGNHAQAVAWAAAQVDVDSLVVMVRGASAQKVAATRAYGAAVDLEAPTWIEAFDRLEQLVKATGRVLVHPHEDPLVLAGAGTVGLEIAESVPNADAVVVAVGGGGLIAGIQAAIGDDTRVIAVEPERARAFHAAIEAGHPVSLEPSSIADGCNAPRLGQLPFELCRHLERVLVTEEEIEDAFRFLYARTKLAVEPAAAVAAAARLNDKFEADDPVLVVSGGNVGPEIASGILGFR